MNLCSLINNHAQKSNSAYDFVIMNIGKQLYSSLSTSHTILFGRTLVCPPYVGEGENGRGGHGWTSKS